MCVVVGIVIGVGIFRAPSLVAAMTPTPTLMLAAWVLGGLLCFCGALTYAELAAAYPRVGGEYVYLDRAFGGAVSFLFVWARMTVIQTGTIAATAYVFGDYMARLVPVGDAGSLIWAERRRGGGLSFMARPLSFCKTAGCKGWTNCHRWKICPI